jgi:streptogramin lyase
MHCRLNHGTEEVWSADFPWTFEEAGVADNGSVAGYANGDKLEIAVLDSKGKLLKQHEIEHTFHCIDGPSLPEGRGQVLVHSGADLAFICVSPADQSRPCPWWGFRLSTGERTADVIPRYPIQVSEERRLYERGARTLGDTGLTLCHWLFVDYRPEDLDWSRRGCVYSLADLTGRSVWSQLLADDYTDPTSEKATQTLEYEAARRDAILAVGPGNRFTLRHLREKQAVEYAFEREGSTESGWTVVEVGRKPLADTTSHPTITSIKLHETKSVALDIGRPETKSPIHDIRAIGFSDDGALEFFRNQRPSGLAFVRLNSAGDLDFETDLGSSLADVHGFYDLNGDRWLLQSFNEEGQWVELDVRTGTTKEAPLPDGGLEASIVPLPDGGYLALVPHIDRSTAVTSLIRVGADATAAWDETVWGVGPDDTAFQQAVYFGRGLADVGQGKFALLGHDAVTTIDLDKNVLGTLELPSVLGHKPVYVHSLHSDKKGGVYFSEEDGFWHLDAHRTAVVPLTPCRSDKSRVGLMDHLLAVSPDGRPWTSDGARIYRLDERGVADLALGPSQGSEELAYPEEALVDSLGRVLVRDRNTQAVHVFDSNGRRAFVCQIPQAERTEHIFFDSMRTSRDGRLWVAIKEGLAQFDREGRRIASAKPSAGTSQERRRGGWDELKALDPSEKVLADLKQRPDGRWLSGVQAKAILSDGRLLVLESPENKDSSSLLHLYGAKGEPLKSIELPNEGRWCRLSTSSRWILVSEYGPKFLGMRLEDEKVYRFETDAESKDHMAAGLTPDGKYLLVLAGETLTLDKYDLP